MKPWWRRALDWAGAEVRLVVRDDRLIRRVPGSAVVTLGATILTLIVAAIVPKWYITTSRVMVVSSSQSGPTGLAALAAAQLGVGNSSQMDPATPAFVTYATTTNAVADSVLAQPTRTLDTTYRAIGHYLGRDSIRFSFGPGIARFRLRDMITVTSEVRLPVLSIEVSAPDPLAAFDIHKALLASLERFVLQNQTTNGRAQREFTERELLKAREGLFQAEQDLMAVLTKNRNVTNSPEFTFDITRLRRRVDQASQLEGTLNQQLQGARLAEARDTPALVIIDQPELQLGPAGPRVRLISVVVGILVFGFTLFLRPLWIQFGGGQEGAILKNAG